MKQIGITGGIGAGKSLICLVFELLGIPTYPADSRAKWLQSNKPELKLRLEFHFGKKTYLENGELNREYLSKTVFADRDKLNLLNSLVHPVVAEDYKMWCQRHSDKPYILKEAALLFETGSYQQLDAVISVHAAADIRLKRTQARDPQRSVEMILSIMDKQLSEEDRMEKADYIIYNNETKSIIKQVLNLHQVFLK